MEIISTLSAICLLSLFLYAKGSNHEKRLLEGDTLSPRLQQLELTMQTLQAKVEEKDNYISSLQNSVIQLHNIVNTQSAQINNQSAQISHQAVQLVDLEKKVNTKKQGCQTGSHVLGDSKGHATRMDVAVTFNQPFSEPPKVVWGTSGLDIDHLHNTRYSSSISNVNEKGFVFHSNTWSDTGLYQLIVQWMACPAHI